KKPGTMSAQALPSKDAILEYIEQSAVKVGKREIARAFNMKGEHRIVLKQILRELAEEGRIDKARKFIHPRDKLRPVGVLEVAGTDDNGDYYAVPIDWNAHSEGEPPRALLLLKPGRIPGEGDHVLCRIDPTVEQEGYGYVPREVGDAKDGELVRFEVTKTGRNSVSSNARIIERLGHPQGERAISMIAIENHGLPNVFPAALDDELVKLKKPSLKAREDLRKIPLITIDPEDARDHDDTVWAAPDDDKANKGGFVVIVAIADVAHYVHTGSVLDHEALRRGNSVYFPDRVVPMLPEKLSNDLCSLKQDVDRPCLAVRMTFDKGGQKVRWRGAGRH
ncbi:MAG: RNB domain-containing ribonuclease, partial [Alphaproteobacteria bacterium]